MAATAVSGICPPALTPQGKQQAAAQRAWHAPPSRRQSRHCTCRGSAAASRAQEGVVLYDFYNQEVPYDQAWRWQKELLEETIASSASSSAEGSDAALRPLGSLLLLQHPPVYTLGAGATEAHLKFDAAAPPLPLYRTERGGEVTYHGPGQLVLYPILDLRRAPLQPDLHWYLRQLEEVAIRALDACSGLQGERVPGLTGVWVGGRKVAAIGVRASRWVTYHGLALNVVNDLGPFQRIVPCGISNRPVASVAGLLAATEHTQRAQEQQQLLPAQQPLQMNPAVADAWDDPLSASFAQESVQPLLGAAVAEMAAERSQQAAGDQALLEEYRHGLLEAFEEVFGLQLRPPSQAGLQALLAGGGQDAAALSAAAQLG